MLTPITMRGTRPESPMRPRPYIPVSVLIVLVSCATSSSASPSTPAGTPTTAASASASAAPSGAGLDIEDEAEAVLEVSFGPDWPMEGFGSMWVLAPDGGTPAIVRIDPETNEEIARIALPGQLCQGFIVSDDAVWVCTPDGAVRVDPASNEIVASVAFDVGQFYGRLAAGAGSVWALGTDAIAPNTLVRIDPTTDTATSTPLGHNAGAIAFGFDAVWVTAPDDGLLLRIDPASGEITEHATGLPGPAAVNVGPDAIWVTLHTLEDDPPGEGDPTVGRIDPLDGTLVAEIATGVSSLALGGLWATDDAVWVRAPDQFLTRIDPATNEVVEIYTGFPSSGEVTVAFGSVWVTVVERQTVYRLAP